MEHSDLFKLAWGAAKLPASLAFLTLQLLKRKETLGTALQRLGWSSVERRKGPVLWFHVNELGETSTVLPVVYRCLQEYNEKVTVLVTTTCLGVYKLLGESLPQRVLVQLVPLANPITITAFLRKWRPQVGIFLETPFQRELAEMARASGVCLALLNAHMPGEDMLEWHVRNTSRRMLRNTLSSYSLIVPRTHVDVGRFRMFGATLGQMPGWSTDLQQASELGACASRLLSQRSKIGRSLLKRLARRQLWIAANTQPGEDLVVARVHAALRNRHKGLLTVLAPRALQTSTGASAALYDAAVRRMSGEKRLQVELLSTLIKDPERLTFDVDVLVLDDPEALTPLYSLSEIVLAGGSLLPSLDGASSPAAAAVAGCALLMGPHGAQFLGVASDLNHAAILASEEAAAAVAQTGATMRGILPGGFDTPRNSQEQAYGLESALFGGPQSTVSVAAAAALAGRLGAAPAGANGGSPDSGAAGSLGLTWQQLVSETQRPMLSSRPMSAPPTIPENFQLRSTVPQLSNSPFGGSCDASSAQGDGLASWPGSSLHSGALFATPCTGYSLGSGTTPGSAGYGTQPSVYRTPPSAAAASGTGASRSRRTAINRFKWAASNEVIGFGYSWSSDGSDSSAESDDAEGAAPTPQSACMQEVGSAAVRSCGVEVAPKVHPQAIAAAPFALDGSSATKVASAEESVPPLNATSGSDQDPHHDQDGPSFPAAPASGSQPSQQPVSPRCHIPKSSAKDFASSPFSGRTQHREAEVSVERPDTCASPSSVGGFWASSTAGTGSIRQAVEVDDGTSDRAVGTGSRCGYEAASSQRDGDGSESDSGSGEFHDAVEEEEERAAVEASPPAAQKVLVGAQPAAEASPPAAQEVLVGAQPPAEASPPEAQKVVLVTQPTADASLPMPQQEVDSAQAPMEAPPLMAQPEVVTAPAAPEAPLPVGQQEVPEADGAMEGADVGIAKSIPGGTSAEEAGPSTAAIIEAATQAQQKQGKAAWERPALSAAMDCPRIGARAAPLVPARRLGVAPVLPRADQASARLMLQELAVRAAYNRRRSAVDEQLCENTSDEDDISYRFAARVANARYSHVAHMVVSGGGDAVAKWPPMRSVQDSRRLRSDPGLPVAAMPPSGDGSMPGDMGAFFSSGAQSPASMTDHRLRLLEAGSDSEGVQPARISQEPGSFGRAQNIDLPGLGSKAHYRVMGGLDDMAQGEAWANDLMMNTNDSEVTLLSAHSPPGSATATREASGVWFPLSESPQLSRGSFDHYLQSIRLQTMLSSPPNRGRSGLGCTARMSALADKPAMAAEGPAASPPPTEGSPEDNLAEEAAAALGAKSGPGNGSVSLANGGSADKPDDVPLLPMPPAVVPGDDEAPQARVATGGSDLVDPLPADVPAASGASEAPAVPPLVAPLADADPDDTAMASSPTTIATACGTDATPLGSSDAKDAELAGTADSLNSDFEFPEGSVPDDSASGSPTLLATPSIHSSSVGNLQAYLAPDAPEHSVGLGMPERHEAAHPAAPAPGQALTRTSSQISNPSTNSSRWPSIAGFEPPGAAALPPGTASSLTDSSSRHQDQHLSPPAGTDVAPGSNASSASGVSDQDPLKRLYSSSSAPLLPSGKDRGLGLTSTGTAGLATTVFGAAVACATSAASGSTAGGSLARTSSGRPGVPHVDSIAIWLDRTMLAQPSAELQRSQVQQDPMVWYPQLKQREELGLGGLSPPDLALKGVAPGLRAPMHSPARPFDEEPSLGVNPLALASVKTVLFPAAPTAQQPATAGAAAAPGTSAAPAAAAGSMRPGVVTLGVAISPVRPNSCGAALNHDNTSPFRHGGADLVTSAFTIGRVSGVQQPSLPSVVTSFARPNYSSAPQQCLPSAEFMDSAAASSGAAAESRAAHRCTHDALSQLLASPRSPVSPVRVARTLSPVTDRRVLTSALMTVGVAAAAQQNSNMLRQPTAFDSPIGSGTRASSGIGTANEAGSPGGANAWPLPVTLPSINTPRRELQRRLSAPVRRASPPSSPLHSVTAAATTSGVTGGVMGAAFADGMDGTSSRYATSPQLPPMSPSRARGSLRGTSLKNFSSITPMFGGPIAAAACGGGASEVSEGHPYESPRSSRSSSCPNTPTSFAANNASSPFRGPVDAVRPQLSPNSKPVASVDNKSFEETFEAAVRAGPVPSPVRARSRAGSVYTSPYKPPMMSAFAAAMASSVAGARRGAANGPMGPSGGVMGFGRSLFAEEEEEMAAVQDWEEDPAPLSPRANSCNILFSPDALSGDHGMHRDGRSGLAGRAPVKVLPYPPLPPVVSADAAVPTEAAQLQRRHRLSYGSGGGVNPSVSAFADPETDKENRRPAMEANPENHHVPVSPTSGIALLSAQPAGGADGGRVGLVGPAVLMRSQLVSAPTFSRILSLSETDEDDSSNGYSPARTPPQSDSTNRLPRITLSGGPLVVPAIAGGSSLPRSLLSQASETSTVRDTDDDVTSVGLPSRDSTIVADETPRHIPHPSSTSRAPGSPYRDGSSFSYVGHVVHGAPNSSSLAAVADREDSPPRSPAERTSCPRSARPSASPIKPPLQSAHSSPVPKNFSTSDTLYGPLPYMPALSSQQQQHNGRRSVMPSPTSPPLLSPRTSASGRPLSLPASYISPCADPRASPIKVPMFAKRAPSDAPAAATGQETQHTIDATAAFFGPFSSGAATGLANSIFGPSAAVESSSPERFSAAGPGFGGLAPLRTQPLSGPGASPSRGPASSQGSPWQPQPLPQQQWLGSDEEPLLGTRASAPAGMTAVSDRGLPPTPRSGRRDVPQLLSPQEGSRVQALNLHAQRSHQQHMWDRVRVESRTASAAATPRSARALFSSREGPPPLPVSLSSSTCCFLDACASPAEAPRSPRVGKSQGAHSQMHVFALDGAATSAAAGADPRSSTGRDDAESWQLQQARYMNGTVNTLATPRSARVLFPAPTTGASSVGPPASPSWGHVSRQLFAVSSIPVRNSPDPLVDVLSRMTVQVASPVSPQPRLPPPPASPCAPAAAAGAPSVAASSPEAASSPRAGSRRGTPQRSSSPLLHAALMQQANKTSPSGESEAPAPVPTAGYTSSSPGRGTAAGVPSRSPGRQGPSRSPVSTVPASPRRVAGLNSNPLAMPVLPQLPPLPPLPRLRAPPTQPVTVAPEVTQGGSRAPEHCLSSAGWSLPMPNDDEALSQRHGPSGGVRAVAGAAQEAEGSPDSAEAVRRRLFRKSAPELSLNDSAAADTMLRLAMAAVSGPCGQPSIPLPSMPPVDAQEALATLESQFEAAEYEAADLPIETRVVTPTAVGSTAGGGSYGVGANGAGFAGDYDAAAPVPFAWAQCYHPNTAPDHHAARQLAPPSPRAAVAGPVSRHPSVSQGTGYRAPGSFGPQGGLGSGAPRGADGGRSDRLHEPKPPAVDGTQRSGSCHAPAGANAANPAGADPSTAAGLGFKAAAATNGAATVALGSSMVHQRQVPYVPTPAGSTGGPHREAAPGGYSARRRAGSRSAAAAGGPQGPSHMEGYGTGLGQGQSRMQGYGTGLGQGQSRMQEVVGGNTSSPLGSLGGATAGDVQSNVAPSARYAGQYLIPAAQLTCDPRVGPAVWIVSNEDELTSALSALLRDPVERRSRGRAAAQGAAKLASSLVTTVWSVLEDMVIAPALQKYITSSDTVAM